MAIKLEKYRFNRDTEYFQIVDTESDLVIKTEFLKVWDVGDFQDLSLNNSTPLFYIFDNHEVEEYNKKLRNNEISEFDNDNSELIRFGYIEKGELILSRNRYPKSIKFYKGLGYYEPIDEESYFIVVINKKEDIVFGPDEILVLRKVLGLESYKFVVQILEYLIPEYQSNQIQKGYGISYFKLENTLASDSELNLLKKNSLENLGMLFYTDDHSTNIEVQLGLNTPVVTQTISYFEPGSCFLSPIIKEDYYAESFYNYWNGIEYNHLSFCYDDLGGLSIVNFNNNRYFINRYLFFIGLQDGFNKITWSCPRNEKFLMKGSSGFHEYPYDMATIEVGDDGGNVIFTGNFISEFLMYPQLFFGFDHIKQFIKEKFNADEVNLSDFDEQFGYRQYIAWDKIIFENKLLEMKLFEPEIEINEQWKEQYLMSDDFKEEILRYCPFILPENLRNDKNLLKELIEEHNQKFGIIHSCCILVDLN